MEMQMTVWRRRPRRRARAKHADGVAAASPPSHVSAAGHHEIAKSLSLKSQNLSL